MSLGSEGTMPFFKPPTSVARRALWGRHRLPSPFPDMAVLSSDDMAMGPPGIHSNLGHLILLVFEAVLEVVCVSLPGYIVARQGMFDADSQKFLANLNVALFTPCLGKMDLWGCAYVSVLTSCPVFTKLASQLTAGKLFDLGVIPVIFVVQTLVAYLTSVALCRLCGFEKRPRNFVLAMSVGLAHDGAKPERVAMVTRMTNLGLWQFQLAPHLAGHFPIQDTQGSSLGPHPGRQRRRRCCPRDPLPAHLSTARTAPPLELGLSCASSSRAAG